MAQTGFEAVAIKRLQQAGHRITVPRVQVARILSRADRPLTAYGVHQEIVANGGRADVVTVYRVLGTLVELGLVHHIGVVDGYMACSLNESHEEDTEHVVCTSCGRVTELPLPHEVAERTAAQLNELGYSHAQTRVEILAVCPACAVE